MGKIISFSGRIGSGKSELAKICEKAGYKKLYFALPLKKLVADLIRVDISEINDLKYVEKNYTFGKMDFMFLANETGVPYDIFNEKMTHRVFKNVRELLQFIGTDIIRSYNYNWHVNRIREMIDKNENYVFDDTRFENEINLVKEFGGDCWFVIRPDLSKVSNHVSETSLRMEQFGDKVIVNDASLNLFKFKWEAFLTHYDTSMHAREKFLSSTCATNWKDIYADLNEMLPTIQLLEISEHWFTYEKRDFDCDNIEHITSDEKSAAIITYKDGTNEIVHNPFNIEDLKFCL